MIARKKMNFGDLPQKLSSGILRPAFIKAYDCSSIGTLIVWVKNPNIGKQQEFEFSLGMERILSREEREKAFPLPEEVMLTDLALRVVKSYRLEQATDVRYETYDVYSINSQIKFTSCEQIYFSPVLISVADVVRQAVETAAFPVLYDSWSLQEKTNYWVAALYRLRHQTGEMGGYEDDIFSLALVDKMKMVDPNVDVLLPLLIKGLAAMESISQVELVNSFNKRTGFSISV